MSTNADADLFDAVQRIAPVISSMRTRQSRRDACRQRP